MTKLKSLVLCAFVVAAVLAARNVDAARPPAGDTVASDSDLEYLASIGGLYRNKGTDGAGKTYNGIAAVLPRSDSVRLIWWVDNETFSGVGELDRHALVVQWGEKYPVVYSSTDEGVLSGEWDDGAGNDTLELFAPLDPDPAPAPRGTYRLQGVKPDGSAYSGTVSISPADGAYLLVWQTATETHRGKGKRQGNLLQVDRADGMPAIYALDTDGTLRGLLGKGRGEETLSPVR
ncbi:hypothetical protein [Pseudorhodoplanes sp.]|uniref:hypothetical protein n=1 Tax=Pseudorhodoplanes sp. TaxID=1934341 RepID=UPI003D1273A8